MRNVTALVDRSSRVNETVMTRETPTIGERRMDGLDGGDRTYSQETTNIQLPYLMQLSVELGDDIHNTFVSVGVGKRPYLFSTIMRM